MTKRVKGYSVRANTMRSKRKENRNDYRINNLSCVKFNADIIGVLWCGNDCDDDDEIAEVGINKEYHTINQKEYLYDIDSF